MTAPTKTADAESVEAEPTRDELVRLLLMAPEGRKVADMRYEAWKQVADGVLARFSEDTLERCMPRARDIPIVPRVGPSR